MKKSRIKSMMYDHLKNVPRETLEYGLKRCGFPNMTKKQFINKVVETKGVFLREVDEIAKESKIILFNR